VSTDGLLERITIDPNVCFGKPTVSGTCIWVGFILGKLAGGTSVDKLLKEYPSLGGRRSGLRCLRGPCFERTLRRHGVRLKLDENLGTLPSNRRARSDMTSTRSHRRERGMVASGCRQQIVEAEFATAG
jgi:hypothetical protein